MSWFFGGDSQEGKSWIWENLWGNSPEMAAVVSESVQTVAPEKKEESKLFSLWGW